MKMKRITKTKDKQKRETTLQNCFIMKRSKVDVW